MRLVNMQCPNCGANVEINADAKQAFCTYCGTNLHIDDEVQHVQYDNAEETGYQFEKGRQRAQAESGMYNSQPQTVVVQPVVQAAPKKRKTIWWILGWIFIFPLPLTILLLRNKNMKPVLKIVLIALAWILYIGIGASRSNKEKTNIPSSTNSQNVAATERANSGNKNTNTPSKEADVPATKAPTTAEPTTTEPAEPAQTVYRLSSGSYVFGVDLPAGRATVTAISGQGNIISSNYDGLSGINSLISKDSSGNLSIPGIFESYSFGKGDYLYISQTAVVEFEFTSITAPSTGRKYSSAPTYELVSGTYTVGVDIEPGAYRVEATSGKGNFIVDDYTEGGANEIMGFDDENYSSTFNNVILEKDDTVTITLDLHLAFYKSEE